MNKEEILNKYIDLIDKGYCSDCNELNCIDNFPHAKITHAIRELQQENEKLHHYKKLYQSLKKQKEELRSWLEEKIQYIDTIYLGTDRKNYSDDTILDMSSRKWGYKDTLNKLEELESVEK